MAQDVPASPAARKPSVAVWRKNRTDARRPRPHPVRHRIAASYLQAQPLRTAAGTLHAHLREAAASISAARGAAAARAALVAMAGRLADRTATDIAGSHVGLLSALGIHVDPRTAREAVRILAGVSSLIEYQRAVRPSRIRLSSAYRWAVARAERTRIDTSIFAPAAVAQGRTDGLFLAIWHRTAPEATVCDSGSRIDARAHAECSVLNTLPLVLRELPAGRWIRLAADLLLAHGRDVPAVEPGSTAHVRALLVASGLRLGFADVGCLVRGLRWLARNGYVRALSSCLWTLDIVDHPDLVILGIVEPADDRECSQKTAAYLQRHGVVAPWSLGAAQAEALRRRLWWRASKDRPSLPELRLLLELEAHPVDVGAYAASVARLLSTYEGECRLVDVQWADRAGFSRWMSSGEPATMSVWPEEPDDTIDPRAGMSSPVPPVATGDRGAYRPARARPADDQGSLRDSRGVVPGRGRRAPRAGADVGGARRPHGQEPPVPPGEARLGGGAAGPAGVPRARAESPAADPRLRVPVLAP